MENYRERGTTQSFELGDWVTFKKNILSHDMIKDKSIAFHNMIKSKMDSDLHLKVSCIKQTPGSNYIEVDVMTETAHGLWTDVMSVPAEVLELAGKAKDAPQHGIPDSMKEKTKVKPMKPAPKSSEVIGGDEFVRDLPKKDTKFKFGRKWKRAK